MTPTSPFTDLDVALFFISVVGIVTVLGGLIEKAWSHEDGDAQ
jgi:hypothetical protein